MAGALPLLVIVSGAPGAGKTTLARTVSDRLRLPLLSKDELKEAIGDEVGLPADVPASQRLGLAAYRVMFLIAARIVASGGGVIVESNFRRGVSEPELHHVVQMGPARLIHCTAAPAVILGRYTSRFQAGDRHPVHLDAARATALSEDLASGRFEPLELDIPKIVVGTDEGYQPSLEVILEFLTTDPVAVAPHLVMAAR